MAFSEWYHKILEEAEVIDQRYAIKGMLVYRKWGLFIIRAMQRELERMLEDADHEPVLFPVLIPEDILGKETEHIAGFEEEVFWVTRAGANELERKLALRPTSETPIYDLFSLWVRSHSDLPLKIHQSCAVYRYETKHTRPLIRGREFLWNEGHSAHADAGDAQKNIDEIKEIYRKLINDLLCLPYQINERPEWDRFPGAEHTFAFDTLMPTGKALQIATAHDLGENFSRVFDIKYETGTGEHRFAHQTSYGPSFGRLLASAISVHGDDKGLVLPPRVAPVQVVIVPIIFKKTGGDVMGYVEKVRDKLEELNVRVRVDDGDEHPGAKYYYWEMKGVPVRFEIGPRDLKEGRITLVRRDTAEKSAINFDEIPGINETFKEIADNLREIAQKKFDERLFTGKTMEEIKGYVGSGIVTSGWCGEKSCAGEIEEFGDILGVGACEHRNLNCPVCGGSGYKIRIAKVY